MAAAKKFSNTQVKLAVFVELLMKAYKMKCKSKHSSMFDYIVNGIGLSKKLGRSTKEGRHNQATNERQKRREKEPEERTKITMLKAKLKQSPGPLLFLLILTMVIVGTNLNMIQCEKGFRIVQSVFNP